MYASFELYIALAYVFTIQKIPVVHYKRSFKFLFFFANKHLINIFHNEGSLLLFSITNLFRIVRTGCLINILGIN